MKKAELLILELLTEPMYGLELIEASNGKLCQGTIYIHLDRLEDAGHVKSKLEDWATVKNRPMGGVRRRIYENLNKPDDGTKELSYLQECYQ